MSDTKKFLTALFNRGEEICYGDTLFDTYTTKLESALWSDFPKQFVSANPLRERRADANVTAYRNFVFEFDGLSLDEQAEFLRERDVPYTTLTYSGGKSLHAVIALDESVSSPEIYRETFKLIRYVLWQTDPSCKNPSRFTRVGGAFRADKDKVQTLMDLKRRITLPELYRWLSRFAKHIERCQQMEDVARREKRQKMKRLLESGAGGVDAVDEATHAFLRGEVETKCRHNRLLAAAYEYFECGVDFDKALDDIEAGAVAVGVWDRDPDEARKIVEYVYLGQVRRA